LGPEGGTGLEGADVVVIARPTRGFPPKAVEALRNYLNPTGTSKMGKLIVLLSTQVEDRRMLETGLEPLLREFNVEVGTKRILMDWAKPQVVRVYPDPASNNPVAKAFSGLNRRVFDMKQPRRVDAAKGATSRYAVERLLVTVPNPVVWEE